MDTFVDRWLHTGHSRIYGVAYCILGVVCVALTFVAVAAWLRWQDQGRLLALVIIGPVLIGGAYVLLRSGLGNLKAAVMVADRVVIIRNPWKTYELPLDAVDRFEAVRQSRTLGEDGAGLAVIDRRGREIYVRGFFRDCFRWNREKARRRFEPDADKLNALVDRARSGAAA